jgi:hypothetical protein
MIQDMFRDDATKQLSLTRVSSAVVLGFNLLYALKVVSTTGQLPDLGNNWLILICALYGINKSASTWAISERKVEECPLSTQS